MGQYCEAMTENAAPGPDDVTPDSTSVPPPPSAAAAPPASRYRAALPPPAPVAAVPGVAMYPNGKPMLDAEGRPASPKSRLAAALLAWFLGFLGIHRFYVGKVGTGILMIVTLGGLGIWVLIDFIIILLGSFKDKEERYLANW